MAHKWVGWLHISCCLGGIQHFRAAHKITWAARLHNPCRLGASPVLHSGGENEKWATSGWGGFIIPTSLGVFNALECGTKSGVAHMWPWSAT